MLLNELKLLEIDGSPFTDSLAALGLGKTAGVDISDDHEKQASTERKPADKQDTKTNTEISNKVRANVKVKELLVNNILLPIPKPISSKDLKVIFEDIEIEPKQFFSFITSNMSVIMDYFEHSFIADGDMLAYAKSLGMVSREALLEYVKKKLPAYSNASKPAIQKMVLDHEDLIVSALVDQQEAMQFGESLVKSAAKQVKTMEQDQGASKRTLVIIQNLYAVQALVNQHCAMLLRLTEA